VQGAASSLLCYRDSYEEWQSVRVSSAGIAALDVRRVAQASVQYVEVLAQGTDGTWSRTLLFPPPDATPAEARFYANWRNRAVLLAGVALLLCAAPWIACATPRLRSRMTPSPA
jgi:hypothetical protein